MFCTCYVQCWMQLGVGSLYIRLNLLMDLIKSSVYLLFSVSKRGLLNYLVIIVDLSISACSSVTVLYIYWSYAIKSIHFKNSFELIFLYLCSDSVSRSNFALKFILSDINIVISDFSWLMFAWHFSFHCLYLIILYIYFLPASLLKTIWLIEYLVYV